MAGNPPATDRDPQKDDRRKSDRFPLVVSVALQWHGPSGQLVRCEGRAVEGNAQGGFLEIPFPLSMGTEVEVQNLLSGEALRARVVRVRSSKQGELDGVAVAFLSPAPLFWGVTFRLKKATAELRELEQEIKSGGIDSRVLRDFRDAVDYVRKTAWAVQEWQERQAQHHDTATVLPLLVTERVRRATQLSNAVVFDLKAHEATSETPGMEDLFRAIERLRGHLSAILKPNLTS